MRTLVVDIGNTTSAAGLYVGGRVRYVDRIATHEAGVSSIRACVKRFADRGADRAVLSTVVPRQRAHWQAAARKAFGRRVLWLTHAAELGIPIDYPAPETIGTDRLANAAGGAARYGAPVIVIDAGTAMKFDVVTASRGYVGGIIAPGRPVLFDALADRTAMLPQLEAGPARGSLGRSTAQALQLGVSWGQAGAAREILDRLRRRFGGRPVTVCITGGDAARVSRDLDAEIHLDPTLTLFGLGHIADLNPP